MSLKSIISSLLFLYLSFYSVSQKTFEEIKNKKIDFSNMEADNLDELLTNINTFIGEELDSLDIKIFSTGPILGSIIMSMSDSSKITYNDLYDEYIKFKKDPRYKENRRKVEITFFLDNRLATIQNWGEDKKMFIELNLPSDLILQYEELIKSNSDNTLTYKNISEIIEKKNTPDNKKEIDSLIDNGQTIDIEGLLKKSKELNKPIILYFTGVNCINCVKLNHNVLSSPKIAEKLLNEFLFIPLYVDDRTELPLNKRRESVELRRDIVTIGDENMTYQISRFNLLAQPYIVILDSNNEILGITTFEINGYKTDKFTDFLNESLVKFKK